MIVNLKGGNYFFHYFLGWIRNWQRRRFPKNHFHMSVSAGNRFGSSPLTKKVRAKEKRWNRVVLLCGIPKLAKNSEGVAMWNFKGTFICYAKHAITLWSRTRTLSVPLFALMSSALKGKMIQKTNRWFNRRTLSFLHVNAGMNLLLVSEEKTSRCFVNGNNAKTLTESEFAEPMQLCISNTDETIPNS